jgi:polyisoprenoid-binding protein YceI
MPIKNILMTSLVILVSLASNTAQAAEYKVDTNGMHAFIEFKVPHMGFSIIGGRFNKFMGTFNWDKDDLSSASAEITIETNSIDTNHKERDNHLTSKDFLDVAKHPTATFKSTAYNGDASSGKLSGDFTLNGVTKPVTLDVKFIGEGKDPWGGYRAGFSGTTTLNGSDFGYASPMFPSNIELSMAVEGVRQ